MLNGSDEERGAIGGRKSFVSKTALTLKTSLTVWIKRVLLKKQLAGDDEAREINGLDEVNTMPEDRIEQWSRKLEQDG